MHIAMTVNRAALGHDAEPRTLLVHVLRGANNISRAVLAAAGVEGGAR